ncbi:hypothetical protein JCM10213_006177 [Rhodosporidiobolus nylandii]
MTVRALKTSDDYKTATTGSGFAAILFHAAWDESSKALKSEVEKYAKNERYSQVQYYAVDIAEAEDIAMDSGVKLTPTVHFLKDGAKVSEYTGSSAPAFERALAASLAGH